MRRRKRNQEPRSDSESGPGTVNVARWERDLEQPGVSSEPGPGVVSIPAADGYHFGDDHRWGVKQQTALVTSLTQLEETFSEPANLPAFAGRRSV